MNNIRFDTPQRQSTIGVIVLFANSLQKILRALWPPLLIFVYRSSFKEILILGIVVLIISIISLVIAFLKHRKFTFYLDEVKKEFVLNKGLISKKRITISLDRIQQVNINQNILQKLIGIYSLEIDSAGSNSKEVSISAIKYDLANALRVKLMEFSSSDEKIKDAIDSENIYSEVELLKVDFLSLVKTGLTSNYTRSLTLFFAFFFTVYDNIRDFITTEILSEDDLEQYINSGIDMSMILIFAVLVVLIAINLLRTIFTYYDLVIVKHSNSLLFKYGFFAKKNTIISPNKVQEVEIRQNVLQKKMNLFRIFIRQANSNNPGEEKEKLKTQIEIPGINLVDRDQVLELLLNKIPNSEIELKPNLRFLLKRIYLGIVFLIVILVSSYFYFDVSLLELLVLGGIYISIASLLIWRHFKNYRLFLSKDFIIKKRGAFDVSYHVIEPRKIQAIKLKQYFWHKKSNVCHLEIYTAGSVLSFEFADFNQINYYLNYWLYQVETSNKPWM